MSNTSKLTPEEKQTIFGQIEKDISKWQRQRRLRWYLAVSAAACIALLATILYPSLSVHNDIPEENLPIAAQDNVIDPKDIQLVLASNKTITVVNDADISYDKQGEIVVNTADEQIKTSKDMAEKIALNTLIVPKGKRSSLTLADGTKIWINSGSTLKFPTEFKTKEREIWVEGEIYIEVKKDETKPFHVNTPHMQIEVTGTRFNVTAYNEDKEQSVVLVEGGVNVNVANEKVSLSPDHLLSVTGDKISTKRINVYDYISWKDGLLQFTSEPLSHILTRLSRYYDTPITCDEQVKDLKCNGKLVLFDNVEDVLKTIYNTIPINYSINEGQIFIQKK